MDFKKNLKISLSSVAKMYVVCAILRDALTYLYPNQISQYFNLDPPITTRLLCLKVIQIIYR